MKKCIVVTGLPASGKSTLGKKLADFLKIDFIDKDYYLERLFIERGVGDQDWRRTLSRESDLLFIRDAQLLDSVIIVSHWNTARCNVDSGTPTNWLNKYFSTVVELYCSCAVETAATRFKKRVRHSGHLDDQKSYEDTLTWMAEYRLGLPLGLGKQLVMAETDSVFQVENIDNEII